MYQKLTLIGNLGKDPEMRYTPTGQAVTNLSLATNRTWNDASGQRVKETTWFRISVWGKMAESCNQYLRKGSKVLIEGRLNTDPATGGPRIWTRQDGTAGATFEVTAEAVKFLSSRGEDDGYQQGDGMTGGVAEEEDIPF
jgi:single-strand DNA-binding protein